MPTIVRRRHLAYTNFACAVAGSTQMPCSFFVLLSDLNPKHPLEIHSLHMLGKTARIMPLPTTKATSRRFIARLAAILLAMGIGDRFVSPPLCLAGGGPENVFLLVNSSSQDSLTIANHYIKLRDIPPTNVFYVQYNGNRAAVSGENFRKFILLPALEEIKKRNLTSQIDYLVYSSDFPWRVSLKSDFPNDRFAPQLRPDGSLTGMTYLHAFVTQKRKEVVSPKTNWYFIEPMSGITISRAFRSQYRWAIGGKRTAAQGLSYLISAQLGVTDGRANTVPEVVNCLRLAKQADGTKPKGTVYFMKHNGPRSTPRHDKFAAAASELRSSGVAAMIENGKFPSNRRSIAGLTCGTSHQNVGKSGCRFLPGAFVDNLTSSGAIFTKPKNPIDPKTGKKIRFQVKTADFIRHGATAACGTVIEPFNIKQKFPNPSLHVHYAKGCSMGESFYQSVSGPYQQLLVGDPLCQPWADIPKVRVAELVAGQMLSGQLELTPEVEGTENPIREYELFVDGVRTGRCRPGQKLQLDTEKLRDGHHEIRVVARDDTPIETQGRLIADVMVKNGRDAIGLSAAKKNVSAADKFLDLKVSSTTTAAIEVICNNLKLGSVPSGSGKLRVALDKLGAGPVELYARSDTLRSQPLRLQISQ